MESRKITFKEEIQIFTTSALSLNYIVGRLFFLSLYLVDSERKMNDWGGDDVGEMKNYSEN